MMTIFLFDIDMTLIRTNGAGRRAMTRTFRELYGVDEAFAGMEFAGRTDGAILRDCYGRHELHERDLAMEFGRFRAIYFDLLKEELVAGPATDVLPGVAMLLETLAARPDVRLGLGTGNYRSAAEIKLRHAGIWDPFLDGGFADDSEDRAEVIAEGARRLGRTAADRVWIVGDSEHDVSAGRANGIPVIGVATGHCSAATLTAAGANAVLSDLADVPGFLALTLS
ncbi:MAG TPA: HAD family hydrolase [Dehalococcoidia bacterium]|nr:HAD family hydrolase [Dehalococcoidia bacterium]